MSPLPKCSQWVSDTSKEGQKGDAKTASANRPLSVESRGTSSVGRAW